MDGNGSARGASVGNGNSFANGDTVPSWLRHSEFYFEAWLSRTSIWTVMA